MEGFNSYEYLSFVKIQGERGREGATGSQGLRGVDGIQGPPGPTVSYLERVHDQNINKILQGGVGKSGPPGFPGIIV